MKSDHATRALDCGPTTDHRVGRARSRRLVLLMHALITALAAASLVACGDSDEREPTPSSAWDEMKWDEGVWQ